MTRAVPRNVQMPFPNHRTMKVVMEKERVEQQQARQIAELIGWGMSYAFIAEKLGLEKDEVRQIHADEKEPA